ncbi:CocE/NonD family hydrolase (plasmid) [Streptomyces sp. CA-142005]|uniref:CocE/NonD family hydrolase n=1 Tax=Streptomyces sp. CA-142005 TaxID=3240052 RepID=UPI003D922B6A
MSTAVPVPFGTPVPQAEPHRVRLGDGVRLHTEVHLPPSRTRRPRLPAVLIRTPYDKTHPDTLLPDIAARLTEAQLAVVTQDVRGKIRSEGRPVPFTAEVADAWDTLDWVTAQRWSNGTVGCWGNSSYGFTAWAAAASGHPVLRARVSRLTTTDIGRELVHRGGVFRLGPMGEWLTSTWAGRADVLPAPDWSRRPLAELLDALPDTGSPLPPAGWATARPGDARWRQPAFGGRVPGHGRIPTLHCTGWYDLFQRGRLRDWQRARSWASAPQYLLAGATDHQDDVFTPSGRSPDHLTDPVARKAMLEAPAPHPARRHGTSSATGPPAPRPAGLQLLPPLPPAQRGAPRTPGGRAAPRQHPAPTDRRARRRPPGAHRAPQASVLLKGRTTLWTPSAVSASWAPD